jgi:predicted nucleic acid-binding protein
VSSELLVTEVPRALRGAPEGDPVFDLAVSLRQAEILFGVFGLHRLRRLTLWRAGRIFEPGLRSLDAIHVTTALELRPIRAFVSYDKRQLAAARAAGLRTVSPGMKG